MTIAPEVHPGRGAGWCVKGCTLAALVQVGGKGCQGRRNVCRRWPLRLLLLLLVLVVVVSGEDGRVASAAVRLEGAGHAPVAAPPRTNDAPAAQAQVAGRHAHAPITS